MRDVTDALAPRARESSRVNLPTLTVATPWIDHMELADDYWAAMAHAGPGVEVLVIDNGSDPPLPNAYRMGYNAGFSRACNVALRIARTDAIVWVNNDIVATHANWAQPIREALEPGVLVGARLRNDPHGAVDGMALPYLDGWCLAGMRDDLVELGGWDETLEEPAYFGDNLLCLEARAAGMTLREARVGLRHKENGTAGYDDRVREVTEANYKRFSGRARELTAGLVAA